MPPGADPARLGVQDQVPGDCRANGDRETGPERATAGVQRGPAGGLSPRRHARGGPVHDLREAVDGAPRVGQHPSLTGGRLRARLPGLHPLRGPEHHPGLCAMRANHPDVPTARVRKPEEVGKKVVPVLAQEAAIWYGINSKIL